MPDQDEDDKLLTLARAAAARHGGVAAAVRDETGRTYVGAPVDLVALSLTALQAAVAAAVASGARRFEAVAVTGYGDLTGPERDLLVGVGAPTVLRG